MDIENDLVDKKPTKKYEYREIFDSDLIEIMKRVSIFNKDNIPYTSFEDTYANQDTYSETEWQDIYSRHKETYDFQTGLRYIFWAQRKYHDSDDISFTITRMFENEFDSIKDKYLIEHGTEIEAVVFLRPKG